MTDTDDGDDDRFLYFQSTYCGTIARHCEALRRTVHIVNLDPAAEHFDYSPLAGKVYYISIC